MVHDKGSDMISLCLILCFILSMVFVHSSWLCFNYLNYNLYICFCSLVLLANVMHFL